LRGVFLSVLVIPTDQLLVRWGIGGDTALLQTEDDVSAQDLSLTSNPAREPSKDVRRRPLTSSAIDLHH